jgi:hypothetical protein
MQGNKKSILFFLSLIWLVSFFMIIPDINRFTTYGYIHHPGDNKYYLVDINSGATNLIAEFKNSYLFGSTYFEMNNSGYVGIIERILYDNKNTVVINFGYFNFEAEDTRIKNRITIIEDTSTEPLRVAGLSYRQDTNSSSLIFSTVWIERNLSGELTESIVEFNINGEILNKIPFHLEHHLDTIKDIHSLDNGSYLTIVSRRGTERGNFLTLVNSTGYVMSMVELVTIIGSFTTNPDLTVLYSATTDVSEIIIHSLDKSEINQVKNLELPFDLSEISYISESTLLVKHFVKPINKVYYSLIASIVFIGLPIYALILLGKRSGVKIDIWLYKDR